MIRKNFEYIYSWLSLNCHPYKTENSLNEHLELVHPFCALFIWLSVRRSSILDDHLVLILKVSILEMVDYIFIQNLTINHY